MVLKRQTVWLLTMLSLIIVLSVYYISMDRMDKQAMEEEAEGHHGETADTGEDQENQNLNLFDDDELTYIEIEEIDDIDDFSSLYSGVDSVSEMFDVIRLQRQDSRSKMREDYRAVIESVEATAEIKSEAFDKHENLYTLQQKEESLETLIKSKGYEDALVIAEDDTLKVYVKADELTKEETVEIMMLSYDHLGIEDIRVGFQSDKN
ncbi:stage III sporulation protein AH [Evansella caseinilytica]|uniref:Stage III sporulation protein AH n=1 Tax=Evansella caseinilytica TaxID=1503961 RepID=A0A1H3KX98_9BACI|nr:SpoIIIAH-like family protein [Evansella caseinilytica]SDY56348.1 stage III sporulation protein AH [Evansella caseinilytica]